MFLKELFEAPTKRAVLARPVARVKGTRGWSREARTWLRSPALSRESESMETVIEESRGSSPQGRVSSWPDIAKTPRLI